MEISWLLGIGLAELICSLARGLARAEPSWRQHYPEMPGATHVRTRKRDPLSRPARHFGRTVEMWCCFELIINKGRRDASDGEADDTYLRATQRQYERLVEICPRLFQKRFGRMVLKRWLLFQMENARACGRGEDIKRIKDLMQSICSFHPALRTNDKESRGFNHPQMGRLLVSAEKVKEWDEDEEFRRRVKEGVETFRPQDYPVFLYEDDKVPRDQWGLDLTNQSAKKGKRRSRARPAGASCKGGMYLLWNLKFIIFEGSTTCVLPGTCLVH
ncbi:hypothetical protein JB92DRAFT_2827811 [Gautieria morchelliformis]|nr:hypothetical protein JB92DRAFT_2827811 [Gautieria morchelliformis]